LQVTVSRLLILPPPTSPDVHKLYWCVGDFHVIAAVKGEEGKVLRPTFDYGMYGLLGLFAKWDDGPGLPAPHRLGARIECPVRSAPQPQSAAFGGRPETARRGEIYGNA
jgi:hypothetical protein